MFFPSHVDYHNADMLEDIKDELKELRKQLKPKEEPMLGSTNKEEVEKRDDLPEHVKTAARVRAATSNIAGLSAQSQIQEQRIETLFERLDRMEKLYMTLLNKMEQFEQQYVTSLRSMVGGGPTVRS